jgi:N-acetyltransferase
MTFQIQPVTLTGHVVALVPLATEHVADLTIAAQDEGIWRYMRYGRVRTKEQMRSLVRQWLAWQAQGTDLPFAVIHRAAGHAIGMTRYMEISAQNRSLEIGGTWYAVAYQRTAVNTESKYLLLCHAFETIGCIRVQIKTDLRNERSQRAIERLGVVREGVLRDHMILPDGTVRSSVFYSILAEEWPAVKVHLQELLER